MRVEIFFMVLLCGAVRGQNGTPQKRPGINEEQTDINIELQKEVNTLKSQIDWLTSTISSVQSKFSDLQTDYKDTVSKLKQTTDQLQSLEQNNSLAQGTLQKYESRISDVLNDNQNLQKIISTVNVTLYDQVLRSTSRVSNISRVLDSLSSDVHGSITLLQQRQKMLEQSLRNQPMLGSPLQNTKTSSSSNGAGGPKIVFLVHLSNDRLFGSGSVLQFDKSTMNEGDGYDVNSGEFVAPRSGIYFFTISLEATNGNIDGLLVRNNVQVGSYFAHYDGRNPAVASTSTYINLDMGDRVWLDWRGSSQTRIRGSIFSHFAGNLVAEEY